MWGKQLLYDNYEWGFQDEGEEEGEEDGGGDRRLSEESDEDSDGGGYSICKICESCLLVISSFC